MSVSRTDFFPFSSSPQIKFVDLKAFLNIGDLSSASPFFGYLVYLGLDELTPFYPIFYLYKEYVK